MEIIWKWTHFLKNYGIRKFCIISMKSISFLTIRSFSGKTMNLVCKALRELGLHLKYGVFQKHSPV